MISIKAKVRSVVAPYQVDLLPTNSIVSMLARAVAIGLLSAGLANAANVLVNPGAETGDSTGWTFDMKASVASTNDYQWNGGVNYPPDSR